MRKKFILTTLLIICIITFFWQCKSIKQAKNFANCDFSIVALTKMNMAGVNVLGAEDISALNFQDVFQLGMLFLSSPEFPVNLTVNIAVKNHNNTLAALNKLEYICLIDDKEMLSGVLEQRIEVPPNGTTTFPMNLDINLKKIFQDKDSRGSAINFGLNLMGNKTQPAKLTIKARPSIKIGKRYLMYPGYIKFNNNLLGN